MRGITVLGTMIMIAGGISICSQTADAQGFTRTSCWAAYDPGANGVGTDPDGYVGGVFDGTYAYFFPYHNGSDRHGEVLRYNVTEPFAASSSWDTFDPGSNGVGTDPDGYLGGCFDGTYVYFSPDHNGTIHHGEVLRYDSGGSFSSAASWDAYDPGNQGVGVDPDGYGGCTYAGGYVYFAPLYNGTEHHGEVLRYDISLPFEAASSWTTFDPGASGVGNDPDGYKSGAFDGRFIYFSPWLNGTDYHGEILRYDTLGVFGDTASWSTFDPGPGGVSGSALAGFHGAVFDQPYLYFVPHRLAGGAHGEVLRYDTRIGFSTASSWQTFDYGNTGKCSEDPNCDDPDGYSDGVIANNFLYLAPLENGTEFHGEVMRYDLSETFASSSSWSTFDPGLVGVGSVSDSYSGAVFDGRYVYFVPFGDGASDYHGEVLRLDTLCAADIPTVSKWGLAVLVLLTLSAGTIAVARKRAWKTAWKTPGNVPGRPV